jgi:leucine dehydrogenase
MEQLYPEPLQHELLLVRRGERSGLYTIVAIHSLARGPALGGCRMWTYDEPLTAMRDALRLARGMTFKAAVADLALGGGKGVIMLRTDEGRPSEERRRAALQDFADTVELLDGRYITAEDVGTSEEDMTLISETTRHVVGLSEEHGGSGDPSPYTALGVEVSIRTACERVWGTDSLDGRSVSVIGLGHVGGILARSLAAAGADLVLSDINPDKRALADELGADWTDPASGLTANVDVVAPCALGGVLNHETIPVLRCKVVAGAANNQLATDAMAELVAERGILWVPDFVANAGGLINVFAELGEEGYSAERAEAQVRGIAATLREIFDNAAASGATPLAEAMELARRRVAEARRAPREPAVAFAREL